MQDCTCAGDEPRPPSPFNMSLKKVPVPLSPENSYIESLTTILPPYTSSLTPLTPCWCRVTDNEPRAAIMRVIANGGRASEKLGVGPDGFGAVVIGE